MIIHIENFAQIQGCYGTSAAEDMRQGIRMRLARVCGKGVIVVCMDGGYFLVGWKGKSIGEGVPFEAVCRRTFRDEIKKELARWVLGGLFPMARFAVRWVRWPLTVDFLDRKDWRYWRDVSGDSDRTTARLIYKAIEQGRLIFEFEAIHSASDSSAVMYYECSPRLQVVNSSHVLSSDDFVPALRRLGLIRCFDLHVMRCALDVLKRQVDLVLGVRISAQSAFDDIWWASVFMQLRESPHIARRLVVNVTATDQVSLDVRGRFFSRLKRLGCHVKTHDDVQALSDTSILRKNFLPRVDSRSRLVNAVSVR